MRCKECDKERKRSILHIGTYSETGPVPHSYYDEDERYHFHSRNIREINYYCSRGHRYSESEKIKCPGEVSGYCKWREV